MDKKLTDSEIVKALECCINWEREGDCAKCPAYESEMLCVKQLRILALDLINRLQAENDTLRSVVKQNHLIRDNNKSPLSLLTAEIKAEAYKEFAERLKRKACMHNHKECSFPDIKVVCLWDIDRLLEELVGDKQC